MNKKQPKPRELVLNFSFLQYTSYFLCPLICFFGLYCFETYGTIFPFLWVSYALIPLLDYLSPLDISNPTPDQYKELEKDSRYLIPLYLMFFTTFYSVFWSFNVIYNQSHQLSWIQLVILVAAMASIFSLGANVGHELQHRSEFIHYIIGILLFIPMLNTAYVIVHSKNHHKYVATPLDPSTAKKGETIYQFGIKGIYRSFVIGWNLESRRTQKQYPKKSKCFKIFHNQIFINNCIEFAFLVYVLVVWDWRVLVFFVLCAKLNNLFLEGSDYIEHYGLVRKEISPGKYERVSVKHSWDAAHRWTNGLLFKLQRHSDHHENGYKPYQTLCLYDESPQLPQGYTLMLLIMTIPFLYKQIMDPLVDAQRQNKLPSEQVSRRSNKLSLVGLGIYVIVLSGGLCVSYYSI